MSDTCCACTGEPVALVIDGAYRKPVCEVHGRMYRQQGYKITRDADHNPREEADEGARAGERGASGTRGHDDAARPADRSTRAQGDA